MFTMDNRNTTLREMFTSFGSSNESVNKEYTENDAVSCLNNLVVLLNVKHPRVSSLLHISSTVYPLLFEKIFGYKPIDLIDTPKTTEDEAHNIQCVIDTLSLDILAVSLSHITGEDILAKKPVSICHLLEIISEFAKVADMQTSRSSVSIPVAASVASSVSHSNASHREHFCPVCEYGLSKAGKISPGNVSSKTGSSVTCPSCVLRSTSQDKENSLVDTVPSAEHSSHTSGSDSLSTVPSMRTRQKSEVQTGKKSDKVLPLHSRKVVRKESSLNEKLSQRLVQNLEHLNRRPDLLLSRQNVPVANGNISMNKIYKSFFQKNLQKKTAMPTKETSVLLPRYLKRRRTISKTQPPSNKKQKVQHTTNVISNSGGILEEIKSEVPGVLFTHDGLNVLRQKHQRQVRLLSTRLSSLRKRITSSERMLQENVAKQTQLAELEKKDSENQERLRNTRYIRNENLKVRGAIKNIAIQKARLKRYYDEYYVQHHKKMSTHQAKSETILQDLYNQRLSLQKQRIIDLNKDVRDQEKEEAVRLGNRMASLENLFLGKTDLLRKKAEEAQMQKHSQVKAQHEVLEKTRRAILKQIENEVKEIQDNLERQDDFHFVESDAERLINQWSKSS